MQLASSLFSEADRQRVRDCVVAAEANTSAEIVPVVATASGRYDRAEDMAGLWLGVLLMIVVAVFWPAPPYADEHGSWQPSAALTQPVKLVGAMIIGFVVGAMAAVRIGTLRRLFTPRPQMKDEVRAKAQAVFFDRRVHHTQGNQGLLIYVSLYERVAVVLADRQVLESVGQPAIDELCWSLTAQLSSAGVCEALCQTILAAGEKLQAVLPGAVNDVNELPDALVTID